MTIVAFVLLGWAALSLVAVTGVALVLRGRARFTPDPVLPSGSYAAASGSGRPARV